MNPHAFGRHPLKMVCLPVPPLPHAVIATRFDILARSASEGVSNCTGFSADLLHSTRVSDRGRSPSRANNFHHILAWAQVAHGRLNVIVSHYVLQCERIRVLASLGQNVFRKARNRLLIRVFLARLPGRPAKATGRSIRFASVPSVSLYRARSGSRQNFVSFSSRAFHDAWTTLLRGWEIANREQTSPRQFTRLRKSPGCSNPQTPLGDCPAKPRREAQKRQVY